MSHPIDIQNAVAMLTAAGYKIKEPSREWEIMEIYHPASKEKLGDGSPFDNAMIKRLIEGKSNWLTHSVRRLSDGIVFSIGDEYECHGQIRKLHHFFINEGGGMFLNDKEDEDYGLNISVCRKILRPTIPNKEERTKKYNSPYPSEVTYASDKNFVVRLKAMIEREAFWLGIETRKEIFKKLINVIGEKAEDCLFEKKSKSSPQLEPTPSNKQEPKEGFKWDDELVKEFYEYGLGNFSASTPLDSRIKKFKDSKQSHQSSSSIESKERTEVTKISSTHIDDYDSKEAWIKATLSKHPDANKMRFVRKAIEYVLNQDDKLYKEWLINDYNPSLYTQEQLDKEREDAFNAARKMDKGFQRKHPTFQDYLTHLSKIKK